MTFLRKSGDFLAGVLIGLSVIFTAVWVATPAQADEGSCMRVNLTHSESGSPSIESEDWGGVTPGDIRTAKVGHYVWFTWFNTEDFPSDSADNVSIDVSDLNVVAVEACLDGAITVITEEPEPAPDPTAEPEAPPTPTIELPDPVELCRIFVMELRVYCSLPNRVIQAVEAGVIS